MHELLFPIVALVGTFFVLIPICTCLSRGWLMRRRQRVASWADFGSESTFFWLVAPVLLPLLWLGSSALHQSESMRRGTGCVIAHVQDHTCIDALILLGTLMLVTTLWAAVRWWRERPAQLGTPVDAQHPLMMRVHRLCTGDHRLAAMRIRMVHRAESPLYTIGLFRPMVVLDACFVRDVDEEILHATLLHERAHMAAFDILRNFLIRFCLSINPAARLLRADFARWQAAREAACDAHAVQYGGKSLALAEGIVRAARFECGRTPTHGVALCGHHPRTLTLRLALLLAGTVHPVRTWGHLTLLCAIVTSMAAPHFLTNGLLQQLHYGVESLFYLPR